MKRRRLVFLLVLSLGLAALIVSELPRRPSGFATPADCLDAYRDASKDGDVARYLSCLGEPLRSEKERALNRANLLRTMEDIKGWTRLDPVVSQSAAYVDVDQVRTSGTARVRIHLQRYGGGWLIVSVDAPKDVPAPVRYGTHVSEVPE
jgi:hypothetical protein